MKKLLYISIALFIFSCNNREKLNIPKKPLILIECEYQETALTTFIYKYKWIDQNGYVFYTKEATDYTGKPARILGDTLN